MAQRMLPQSPNRLLLPAQILRIKPQGKSNMSDEDENDIPNKTRSDANGATGQGHQEFEFEWEPEPSVPNVDAWSAYPEEYRLLLATCGRPDHVHPNAPQFNRAIMELADTCEKNGSSGGVFKMLLEAAYAHFFLDPDK